MPKNNRHGKSSIFSESDFQKLRRSLKNRKHKLLLDIAWWTGERWGAIVKLKVGDVYDAHGTPLEYITFLAANRKDRKTRQVYIHPTLATELQAYPAPKDGWLFPGERTPDDHITMSGADKILRAALERLGWTAKGFSTHSTRRSFITRLHRQGTDLITIKDLTGHASLQNVQRYIESDPKRAEKALLSL
jgi:integrase/recombinase XerD